MQTVKAAMAPKILIVLTSHDQLGSSGKPTGWYLVRALKTPTNHH